jgi:hypothetical protein
MLKGGSVLLNTRCIQNIEDFMDEFNSKLISENQVLFGNAKRQDDQNKKALQILKLILGKLTQIEGDILFVFDNVEELIENDRNNFRMLLVMMLHRLPQLKIVLTSRV